MNNNEELEKNSSKMEKKKSLIEIC